MAVGGGERYGSGVEVGRNGSGEGGRYGSRGGGWEVWQCGEVGRYGSGGRVGDIPVGGGGGQRNGSGERVGYMAVAGRVEGMAVGGRAGDMAVGGEGGSFGSIGGGRRYTVKKNYRIPAVFFTKPFRNGKTPMLTSDFLVPPREGIFCLLRREKYSSLCRGNFFLSVECYISLLNLEENYWKIPGWPQERQAKWP
jgi:hypothetical protein